MEMKTQIQQCLQAFADTDLRTASMSLLNTLGTHPYLQFSAGPYHRSPHQPYPVQTGSDSWRRNG